MEALASPDHPLQRHAGRGIAALRDASTRRWYCVRSKAARETWDLGLMEADGAFWVHAPNTGWFINVPFDSLEAALLWVRMGAAENAPWLYVSKTITQGAGTYEV